jgi:hypothetical protein
MNLQDLSSAAVFKLSSLTRTKLSITKQISSPNLLISQLSNGHSLYVAKTSSELVEAALTHQSLGDTVQFDDSGSFFVV